MNTAFHRKTVAELLRRHGVELRYRRLTDAPLNEAEKLRAAVVGAARRALRSEPVDGLVGPEVQEAGRRVDDTVNRTPVRFTVNIP